MFVYPGDQGRSPKSALSTNELYQAPSKFNDPPVLRNVTN